MCEVARLLRALAKQRSGNRVAPQSIVNTVFTSHWRSRFVTTLSFSDAPNYLRKQQNQISKGTAMLWTLFVVLLVLWLLGVVSSFTLGGFIHILLVLAVIALVFQLLAGRRTVV
jgi:uncharacterized protein DUF5670